jgi:hypothetical protein
MKMDTGEIERHAQIPSGLGEKILRQEALVR